jgi:hypothetical protein
MDQLLRLVLQGLRHPSHRASLVYILSSDRWRAAVVHAPGVGLGGDGLGILHSVRQQALRSSDMAQALGELVSLRKTGTVDDYTERFLAHVARAGPLDSSSKSTSTPQVFSSR